MLVADIEHGEGLINTDNPAALEALRHRPGHSTGTRRHVENLFIALQNEHFSQFLGEISANPRGSAIKLSRVLRIMEMSLVPMPVAMRVFVVMVVTVAVTMFAIVRVLMRVFVVVFMTVMMSMVIFVAVLVLVTMLVTVLVMLMFVSVTVLMLAFVFFAHGFTIPSLKFD